MRKPLRWLLWLVLLPFWPLIFLVGAMLAMYYMTTIGAALCGDKKAIQKIIGNKNEPI